MDKKAIVEKRLASLRTYLDNNGLDGAMLNSYENYRYFSLFTGSNGYLVVTKDKVALVTDKRYTTQALLETVDCEVIEHAANRLELVADTIRKMGIKRIVMEEGMGVGEYFALKEKLADTEVVFESEYFMEIRMVKDKEEIGHIRDAIRCAEGGFEKLIPKLKIGMTEKDLADELHYLVSKEGAEAMSFGTIVASGPRGAMAHGVPTDKVIENGDMVVVDFGVMKDGYCSDMTRTLLFGDISKEDQYIFDLVRESQIAAIDAIRPGALAREVEQAHRDVFLKAGLEDYALKGLGHGIGLEIHECPRIVIGNETRLVPGMVFTVEPGLYFPDRCGVRTEDDVLVTESGCENLSHTPHEIHIG